jgi:folate-binding protein YgfZ
MTPMSAIQLPDSSSWGGALVLTHWGVIEASGPDAASFLHGQFSQDVNSQSAQEARLAAYCSAKGRMLGSLIQLRPQPEQILLLTDSGVLPGLLKRLSMFVLRAKVKLTQADAHVAVVGLLGTAAASRLGDAARDMAPWQALPHLDGTLVRLPDVQGCARWYWVGPRDRVAALTDGLSDVAASDWQWLEVVSGLPRIEASTVDQFVPQMVNFELIGGVNFKKGCYPGQEVVARSQYRGTTKRRAFVLHGLQPMQAGQEVYSSGDPGQPAGMVINAASSGGVHSALVELKLSALGTALHLQQPDGPALTWGELPYPLPTAEEAA